MESSDLPDKDKEPKPFSDKAPNAEEQANRRPKVVVYSGMISHRQGEAGKNPESAASDRPVSEPATENKAKAVPMPRTNAPSNPVHFSTPAESRPAHPIPNQALKFPQDPAKDKNPGRKLHDLEAASKKARPARLPWRYRILPTRERTHRAYWDVTGTISLIVNIILICLVIILAGQVRNLKTSMSSTMNTTVNNLLGGLYGNFVKMDQASINTTINVDAQIPLDFILPVNQNTQVVLTNDVTFTSRRVIINTGGLNIDAPATVTLPRGTTLPIALNLQIPVQSTIPVNLQVPVSIPMNQTELHEPFTGLQTTLRPLYCLLNKNAQYPEGSYICAEHDAPTNGTP